MSVRNFAGVVMAALLCCGSSPASNSELDPEGSRVPPADAYENNLASSEIAWLTVLSNDPVPYIRDKGIVATGPFFIDINHRESSLLVGPLTVQVNKSAGANASYKRVGDLDLRNTLVHFNVKVRTGESLDTPRLLEGGRLVLWFQATLKHRAVAGSKETMPSRHVNYAFHHDFLANALQGRDSTAVVTPDLNRWTCLGRNPVDVRPLIGSAAKYTCALSQAEFAEAMAKPESLGLLFILPNPSDDGDGGVLLDEKTPSRTKIMDGWKFELTNFSIERSSS